MSDEVIRYEDLVQPDDSINKLIEQLTELNKTYKESLDTIKVGAKEIISQLKAMSSATAEGRAEIDESAIAADRLKRAQKELKFAMSDVGKEVAWLKAETSTYNTGTVETRKQIEALAGSYDKLKLQMKEEIALWKSLSAADRKGGLGQDLLDSILTTKNQVMALDEQLKLHIEHVSAVARAEEKLNYLRSEEGKRLLELKQQIREEISAHSAQGPAIDSVARAHERLNAARAASNVQLKELEIQTRQANEVAKLQAQYNLAAEGSYERLAAQYELNKVKLNGMSKAEREAADSGKKLEDETLQLYAQMQKMQEAMGNHKLSVGNYKRAWDGLGISVSQIVRELPAAAVSANTFFLGISNNVPMFYDEIRRMKKENESLLAQGKQAKSIVGAVVKSLFSFNTVLVLGLTFLSMYGKEVIEWISSLFSARDAAIGAAQAIEGVNEALEKHNGNFGQQVETLKKLSDEWKEITWGDDKTKLQWIRDNKSEFDKLNISVRDVNEAENIFYENTDIMIMAMKYRAKAAAAMKLAAEEYEKALVAEAKAETERAKGPSAWQIFKSSFATAGAGTAQANAVSNQYYQQSQQTIAQGLHNRQVEGLEDEAKAAEKTADQYDKLRQKYDEEAKALLKLYNIEEKHKDEKAGREPKLKDLSDTIDKNGLSIRKKYEASISALLRDEYEKRRAAAVDAAENAIRDLQAKYKKNEQYLAGIGGIKPLTEEQKQKIYKQQKEITATIENTNRKLQIDLTDIDYEYEIDRNKKLRQAMNFKLDIISDELEKEKQLRLRQIDEQEKLYMTLGKDANGDDISIQGLSPEQLAEFENERKQIIATYDKLIYELKLKDINAQLELVKKGSEQELEVLMQRNEIAKQLALTNNALQPIEKRKDPDQISKGQDKKGNLEIGRVKMRNFNQQQALDKATFNATKHNEYETTQFKLKQEKERWEKQIELAKQGGLDWSEAQIEAAEKMVEGINAQIKEKSSFVYQVGQKGLGTHLMELFGFNDDQIKAMNEAADIVLDNINDILDAETELAEAEVKLAEKRVDAAKSAYEAEIEARNNGYANNVDTAKKELELEKKNLATKQKLQAQAEKRQRALDTVTQASSLVTASAKLWSAFASIPVVGPALAIAAIAAMWTSFAVAKVKAKQVAAAQQEYGEGGYEVLEGGSHASGHDIDLGTRNSKGRNMRAEGGEAVAVINKRSTKRYKKVLPDLVKSINKGTFEEKFLSAFKVGDELSQSISYNQQVVDLSSIEKDLRALKNNTESRYYVMADGSLVEKRKNVTRITR